MKNIKSCQKNIIMQFVLFTLLITLTYSLNIWETLNFKNNHKSTFSSSNVFQRQLDEYHNLLFKHHQKKHGLNTFNILNDSPTPSYNCTGGKNPVLMTTKEYLTAFAEGPCNPVIALPGIGGAKLLISLDCKIFKEQNPDIFKNCGWYSCELGDDGTPLQSYVIWIPDINSQLSVVKPFVNVNSCFASLFGFQISSNGKKMTVSSPAGVKIYTYGEDRSTRANSECGFKSIQNLLPAPVQPSGLEYFLGLKTSLLAKGYMIGLTVQALPYDWRKSYRTSKTKRKLKSILSNMNEAVGKRVVIVAHSMGNLNMMNTLWSMSQEDKDQMVERVISIAPPFMGSPEASLSPLIIDNNFVADLKVISFGITPQIYLSTLATFPSFYDLSLTRFFRMHRKETWMKEAIQRIREEKSNDKKLTKGTIMDIFPNFNETCVTGVSERITNCVTGMSELWSFGSVEGFDLNPDTLEELYNVYSYDPFITQKYDQVKDSEFQEMKNPGVQVNILYANLIQTISKGIIKKNPKISTMRNQFYHLDSQENELGDSSVLTTSAILPGIKWAQEFDEGKAHAKPVNFIELCSQYKRRDNIFEMVSKENSGSEEEEKERVVRQNAYFGIDCGCINHSILDKNGVDCSHTQLMSDAKLVQFVVNSSESGKKGKVGQRFQDMSETVLKNIVKNCDFFFNS